MKWDWLLRTEDRVLKQQENWINDMRRADRDIFHCESCNMCWQMDRHTNTRHLVKDSIRRIKYYEDFPTIGKPKKLCKHCENLEV